MKWIKVETNLPAENEKVLAWGEDERVYICFYPGSVEKVYNEHWVVCEENDCACNGVSSPIRYWMHLPSSPHKR